MDLELRVATVEDIPALNALIPASVRGLSQGYYTPAQIESALIYVFGVDTQLIADGAYFVVEHDEQIVGAGGWSKRKTLYGAINPKQTTTRCSILRMMRRTSVRTMCILTGRGRGLVGVSCAPVKQRLKRRASRGWT
jgi:hypothetical protein